MSNKLKPCPFCGHTEIRNHNCKTECSYCGARVEFVELADCYDKLNAKDRPDWNDRPIEDALQASITSLEAENAKLKEQIVTWHKYPDEKPTESGRYVIHRRHNVMPRIDVRFWTGKDWRDRDDSVYDRDIAYWAYLPEPPEVVE